mgnify:CR=1 FL=1
MTSSHSVRQGIRAKSNVIGEKIVTSLFQRSTLAMAAAALAFTGIAHADNHAGAPIQYFINKFDGEAKYPADLESYPYLNADAPIYGEYISGVRGGFNDFNSLNGRGDDASGLGLLSVCEAQRRRTSQTACNTNLKTESIRKAIYVLGKGSKKKFQKKTNKC